MNKNSRCEGIQGLEMPNKEKFESLTEHHQRTPSKKKNKELDMEQKKYNLCYTKTVQIQLIKVIFEMN
jgi:hypothetical protein